MKQILAALAWVVALVAIDSATHAQQIQYFSVPPGAGVHDVAPAADGTVWFTAQRAGYLGQLDPKTGAVKQVALGRNSAPHGVIVGPDGAAWVTDGGQNAIVRVDATSHAVKVMPLPGNNSVNLNTAVFDKNGALWFTGQNGYYGRADPQSGSVLVYTAPRGTGPYGITITPSGMLYYASLAGSHIARIDPATGAATPIDSPTKGQGARRVWSDSKGRIWVSEWNAGQLGLFDPNSSAWKEWKLPAPGAQAYAVYVDDGDIVWVTDFTSNAILSFDPTTEKFTTFALMPANASVRQLLGRPGEVWGAESGADRLVVIRTATKP